jgi:hypothetical protein
MNNKTKLILAMMQVESVSKLMKENEYEHFMVSHLVPMAVEMKRQLSNINQSSLPHSCND